MTKVVPIPAVNGVVVNSSNQVLLTLRSQKVREPGKWCIPGGHFDGGEDWIGCLRREIKEELGIESMDPILTGIYSDPKLTTTGEPLQDGYYGQFLVIVFRVNTFEGKIVPNDEVDEWGWFSADSLPSPIVKSHPIRITDAINFKGEVFVR